MLKKEGEGGGGGGGGKGGKEGQMMAFSLQAEVFYKKDPKLLNQFQYCERERIPLVVIVGEEERANEGVKIRDMDTRMEVLLAHHREIICPLQATLICSGLCEAL